jgi:hypothetical protein
MYGETLYDVILVTCADSELKAIKECYQSVDSLLAEKPKKTRKGARNGSDE